MDKVNDAPVATRDGEARSMFDANATHEELPLFDENASEIEVLNASHLLRVRAWLNHHVPFSKSTTRH